MTPTEGGKHCSACDRTVHDLSAMTELEATRVLAMGAEGSVCVRYQPRIDGTIRTAHEPVIPPSRLLAKVKPAALALGTMLASACGPVVEALPNSATDRLPYPLYSFLRHPIDFMACVASPSCDALEPPVLMGAVRTR